jgi:hypothetical protein
MKIWKNIIRVWFTFTSLASFMVGWVILAHSPKPNQFNAANVQPMPVLAPVPSLNDIMFAEQSRSFLQDNNPAMLRSGGS